MALNLPLSRYALALILVSPVAYGQTTAWVQSGSKGFPDGDRKSVVLSSQGELRLGRAVKPLVADRGETRLVSAVAESADKTIYYGTSLPGRVYQLSPGGAEPKLLADLGDETLVSAIVFDGAGQLIVAASGEKPRLLRYAKVPEKPQEIEIPDDAAMVWAMLTGPRGEVYVATGPSGKLFVLEANGEQLQLALDFDEDNLLALAAGPGGSVYVGTDPRGRVYRWAGEKARPTVVLDAPEPEITAIAVDGRGNVLVAASSPAEESGESDSPGPARGLPDADGPLGLPGSSPGPGFPEPPRSPPPAPPPVPGRPPSPEPRQPGATLFLAPMQTFSVSLPGPGDATAGEPEESAEGSALYRVDPEGFTSELFRSPSSFLCMIENDGVVLIGTGGRGTLVQVDVAREEAAEIARLDASDVTTLLRLRDQSVLVGTGNGSSLSVLSDGPAAEGTFTSSVLTATHTARIGTLRLDGTLPPGSAATVSVRSGNTAEPSDTDWSPWSEPVPAERFIRTQLPPGRFAQYRLTFTPSETGQSPVLREVEWAYRVPNLPPRIQSLTVGSNQTEADPAEGATPPAAAATMLQLTWEADDPNGDALTFELEYRPVGETPWRSLRSKVKESSFEWNTREVPEGRYQVRVIADDAPSNPEGESRRTARVSGVLLLDHQPPVFSKPVVELKNGVVEIRVQVQDSVSSIRATAFRLNGEAEWRNADAGDKLFDSPLEDVTVLLRDLVPGRNIVHLRATDSNGNEGFETVVVEGPVAK
jgi:hypothetical protein